MAIEAEYIYLEDEEARVNERAISIMIYEM